MSRTRSRTIEDNYGDVVEVHHYAGIDDVIYLTVNEGSMMTQAALSPARAKQLRRMLKKAIWEVEK